MKYITNPVSQNIQNSKLHRLTEFFPVSLPILSRCRFTYGRFLFLAVDQRGIRYVKSFYQQSQQFLGRAKAPVKYVVNVT